jgi:hypothetical protein
MFFQASDGSCIHFGTALVSVVLLGRDDTSTAKPLKGVDDDDDSDDDLAAAGDAAL